MFLGLATVLAANPAPFVPALTICIDPGHPSEVSRGTQGKHVSEIHVAWMVALDMQQILKEKGIHVVMTKHSEDERVTNNKRAMIANACHASLLVRLHCDAASGSGFTTYYPDRQGHHSGYVGPPLALLAKILPIATQFHKELHAQIGGYLRDNGLKSDMQTAVGSKYGALIGSIYSKVPTVLVEMCVLTNPSDESKVLTKVGQRKLAESLAMACIKSL